MDSAAASATTFDTPPAVQADHLGVSSVGAEAPPAEISKRPSGVWRRAWRGIRSACEWCFGAATLTAGLAILASVPLLNLLSLGYLVLASGAVARTGRLRDGFLGVRRAARAGSVVLGTFAVMLPVWFASQQWDSARLIDPASAVTRGWRIAQVVLAVLTAVHIVWACWRGGKLRHFFWPAPLRFVRWLGTPGKYVTAREALWARWEGLHLIECFWTGLRAFIGALIWLAPPVGMLLLATRLPEGGAVLLSLVGGLMLMVAAIYLPFLQARFGAMGEFRDLFRWRAVREDFRRAPLAFWLALCVTLLFAVPLYLLKIELTPREVAWLPSLLFVMFIFPARLLAGWAVGRARRRDLPRIWISRWTARLAMVPVAGFYALIVYATQYLSWYGALSLLEQHAFGVPAPLFGL